MRGTAGLQRHPVAGIGRECDFGKVQRFEGRALLGVLARALGDGGRSARQLGQLGVDAPGWCRVELRRGSVVEPARVVFPDGAHAPGHLAVALTHFELGGKRDVAHQLLDRCALVHPRHDFVVDVLHRAAEPLEF